MAVSEQVASERPWPAVLAPLALVAGLGAALVGGLLVGVVAVLAGASLTHPPPVVALVSTMLLDAGFVASAVFFAARVARPRPEQFGLRPVRIWPAVRAVVIAYVAFTAFSAVWAAALHLHEKLKQLDQLGANDSVVALVAVCLLTCVIAPVCEEFFFRGFFFTAIRNRSGPWPAAVITGIAFGAIHAGSAPVGQLVPLAFFGFALCIVYWRTGSLYPCVGLHALNNAVAVGLTEHWNWQIPVLVAASLAAITVGLSTVARIAPAQ